MLEVRLVGSDSCRRYQIMREVVLREAERLGMAIQFVEETEVEGILNYQTLNLSTLDWGAGNRGWESPFTKKSARLSGVASPITLITHLERDWQLAYSVRARLYDEFRIEVPIVTWNGRQLVRVSLQAYNKREDVDAPAHALSTLLPQISQKQ